MFSTFLIVGEVCDPVHAKSYSQESEIRHIGAEHHQGLILPQKFWKYMFGDVALADHLNMIVYLIANYLIIFMRI